MKFKAKLDAEIERRGGLPETPFADSLKRADAIVWFSAGAQVVLVLSALAWAAWRFL